MPGCDISDVSKLGTAEAAVNESEKTGVKPIAITKITLGSLKATAEGGVAMTISGDKTALTIDGSLWDGSVVLELQPKASIAFGASDGNSVTLATCVNNSEKPKIFRGKYETKGTFSPFTGNVMRKNK
ncbi:MAG: hypothetical protein H7230_04045 [Candidatus Parcubacteria bacterium]|nr:hypothetical protein [Candidatus Paceibacterota bacterium]